MTKPNSTEIVVVLDRSGSMAPLVKDMEGGFGRFIDEQRAVPGECAVTLVQFDTIIETVYGGKPIAEVPRLRLEPRGGTALLDAIGVTIQSTGARLAVTPEHKRPSKVIVVVITDGQENSSREYTRARVFDLIKHQQSKYSWDFIFLGTTQNAIHEAQQLGLVNNAIWTVSSTGSAALYNSVSSSVTGSRTSGAPVVFNQVTYDSHVTPSSGGK